MRLVKFIQGVTIAVALMLIFLLGMQAGYIFGWNSAISEYPQPIVREWDPQPAVCVQPPQEAVQSLVADNVPSVHVEIISEPGEPIEKIMLKEVPIEKKVYSKHEFFGLAGIGPSGVNVDINGNQLNVSQSYGPVVGGGYKFHVTENFGVGGFGMSNLTFGVAASWRF